jgi:hypothetical protein
MTIDFITVLTHGSIPLSKRWCSDGSIQAFGNSKHFAGREIQVSDFGEMAAVLTSLHAKPRACVIRGKFTGQDISNTVRQKDVFADTEHHWLLIDVDKYQPLEVDPVSEPVESIEQYISEHLPPEFHQASYHWQLSNSAGHPSKQGLRAHLWFWSETPHTSATLRAWGKGYHVDQSLFDEIQIHYTAAPVFDEGVTDPVPARHGTVRKTSDSVALAATPAAPGDRATRQQVARETLSSDPVAQLLYAKGMVKSERRNDMGLNIECPCAADHTGESGESATIYYPANTGGYSHRAFKCLHAHCIERPHGEFLEALGYEEPIVDMFDDVQDPDVFTNSEQPEELNSEDWFAHHVPFTQRPVYRYLVKGLLPISGVAAVYGASGSGKSFFALDLVMAVARGEPWRGHRVHGGAVAYLCAEGFIDFQDRVDAYGLQNQLDPCLIPFYLMGKGINWTKPDVIKRLVAELRKIPDLRVLVLDTLSKLIAGQNENDNAVMSLVVDIAEKISRELGILVLFIHHTGKGGSEKGPRGGSAFEAGVDSAIYVDRPEKGDVRLATVTKMKGGADGGELKFKLQLVSLNRVDEDGDQLFSCVIEETNEPVGRRDDAGKGANQRAILAEIDDVQGLTDQGPGFHDLVKGAVERTNGKTTAKTMRVAVKKMIAEGELVDTPRGILRA